MIAVIGVAVLGGAAIGIALLSAIAANHPNRAAMVLVLGAAAGGMLVIAMLSIGVLGMSFRGAPAVTAAAVQHHPQRVVAGLAGAVVLVAVATWLIRSGDWDRD